MAEVTRGSLARVRCGNCGVIDIEVDVRMTLDDIKERISTHYHVELPIDFSLQFYNPRTSKFAKLTQNIWDDPHNPFRSEENTVDLYLIDETDQYGNLSSRDVRTYVNPL